MHLLTFSLLALASAPTILKPDGFSDGEPINDATGKGASIIGMSLFHLLALIKTTKLLLQGELIMNLTCKTLTTWDARVLTPAMFQTSSGVSRIPRPTSILVAGVVSR